MSELNADPPAADAKPDEKRNFAAKQLKLFRELYSADDTDERGVWLASQAYVLNQAYQAGLVQEKYTRDEIVKLTRQAAEEAPNAEPTIEQQRLFMEFAARRKAIQPEDGENIPQDDADKLNEWWSEAREGFVKRFADAGEAAGFLLDLAMEAERDRDKREATGYYRTLAQKFPETPPGRKAAGAMRRLNLVGKELEFRVPLRSGGAVTADDYRGKVLLMTFWTTDCEPCTENLPILKDLQDRFGRDGFEILAVNLDRSPNPIEGYLKKYRVDFPVAYEPGSFEGETAMRFGVVNLPTMILADRQGRVVGADLDAREVKRRVEELMK